MLSNSGGLQEEATALGVPCIAIRDITERLVRVEKGSSVLVGADPARVTAPTRKVLRREGNQGKEPQLRGGKAAERIVEILAGILP